MKPETKRNETINQPNYLTIVRREYGYAGISGIGIDTMGKLTLAKDLDILQVAPKSRVIENPPVENALSAPVKVFFDPSLSCPLNCSFCLAGVATSKEQKQSLPSLSQEKTRKINDQLIQMGVLQVKMGGGEPFVNPYFWESLDQLGSAGIALSTSTSGFSLNNPRLLPDEKIESLIRNRVKVSISIDGDPTYHDNIRGMKGLFETAILGRLRLLKHGFDPKKIEMRATIINSQNSMDQLEFLNKLSLKLQTKIRIRVAKPSGSATVNGVAVVYPTQEFWKLHDNLRKFADQNPLLDLDDLSSYDKPSELLAALDCGAGTRSAFVDANGNFMPCGFIDEHFPLPFHDIFSEGKTLLELWQDGQAFKDVRSYIKKENETNPCASCGHVHSCQGGCPSIRLSSKSETDPRCPIEKKVFAPIDITRPDGVSTIFAGLSTGSILHYKPIESDEDFIVFSGESNNGSLIITTPGGKMNAELDSSLLDTSHREILEETSISQNDLDLISAPQTKSIVNGGKYQDIQKFQPHDVEQLLSSDNNPAALILNIPDDNKHDPALIAVYEYMTKKQPVPTSENQLIILIPKSKMSEIGNAKTYSDLTIGKIITTEQSIHQNSPIKFVGTANAIVNNQFNLL
ncbi:conserved hypothetical protein [Candidatus Roizmanbacteria bacterium]|nr:conserved hypothetical protein [Candidatus Roizmanbacteria bacterium]